MGTHVDILGNMDYYLTDIVLDSLELPISSVKILPNEGLQIVVNDVSCHVALNWNYREEDWPHISGSGTADISIEGSNISVAISITESKGRPYLKSESVQVSLGSFNIDDHGGASWFYNLLIHLFSGKIKESMQTVLQSQIGTEIDTLADEALQTLPFEQTVGCCIELD